MMRSIFFLPAALLVLPTTSPALAGDSNDVASIAWRCSASGSLESSECRTSPTPAACQSLCRESTTKTLKDAGKKFSKDCVDLWKLMAYSAGTSASRMESALQSCDPKDSSWENVYKRSTTRKQSLDIAADACRKTCTDEINRSKTHEESQWESADIEGCRSPTSSSACDRVTRYLDSYPGGVHAKAAHAALDATASKRRSLEAAEQKAEARERKVAKRHQGVSSSANASPTTASCMRVARACAALISQPANRPNCAMLQETLDSCMAQQGESISSCSSYATNLAIVCNQ